MNMLHLLRHAKSSAKDDVEDHQRPLSRRGREAARRVGEHLPAHIGALDLVLCSSALRTRETLDLVVAGFSPRPRSLIEGELYLSSRERLLDRLRRLDAKDVNVMLIGHNPGLHELALSLAAKGSPRFEALASGKFPTCAYASFRVPVRWSALGFSRHELIGYVTPGSLAGEQG
jgi:phosphohistidine phosphatase